MRKVAMFISALLTLYGTFVFADENGKSIMTERSAWAQVSLVDSANSGGFNWLIVVVSKGEKLQTGGPISVQSTNTLVQLYFQGDCFYGSSICHTLTASLSVPQEFVRVGDIGQQIRFAGDLNDPRVIPVYMAECVASDGNYSLSMAVLPYLPVELGWSQGSDPVRPQRAEMHFVDSWGHKGIQKAVNLTVDNGRVWGQTVDTLNPVGSLMIIETRRTTIQGGCNNNQTPSIVFSYGGKG